MLFKKEMIQAIINGTKSQTRRLVKENELAEGYPITKLGGKSKGIRAVIKYTKGKRKETIDYSPTITKWKIGKKYAVCPGRGKLQVIYCPKCNTKINFNFEKYVDGEPIRCHCENSLSNCVYFSAEATGTRFNEKAQLDAIHLRFKNHGWKPLFVEITEIRQEKLLDITEEDAKKEGFKNKKEFIKTFYKINTLHQPSEVVFGIWNPNVWVLNFKRVD